LFFIFETTKTSSSKKTKRNEATIATDESLIKKFVINGSDRKVNDFCLDRPVKPIVKRRFLKDEQMLFKNLIYFFLKYDLIFAMIFLKKIKILASAARSTCSIIIPVPGSI
tara:strand:+ start:193 stop:525 length:333 start_codon:yes stop_codon:yes gene_type:complete